MAVCILVAAVLVAVDQILKFFVVSNLKPIGSYTLIDGFLNFTYLENNGMAFGLLQNYQWLISLVTVIGCIAIFILALRYKHHNFWSLAAVTLILAGGIGNLIDRAVLGFVVDYIHFLFFPFIFNFADCCVTVGAVCLIIYFIVADHRQKREEAEMEEMPESLEDKDNEPEKTNADTETKTDDEIGAKEANKS